MGHLDDIPVFSQLDLGQRDSNPVNIVLLELLRLMDNYLQTQAAGAIDIKSLPLAESDYERLKQVLAPGNIQAQVNVSGTTEIYETIYSGIWWFIHKDSNTNITAEHIEVGRVPAILCSHNEDIRLSREKLGGVIPD